MNLRMMICAAHKNQVSLPQLQRRDTRPRDNVKLATTRSLNHELYHEAATRPAQSPVRCSKPEPGITLTRICQSDRANGHCGGGKGNGMYTQYTISPRSATTKGNGTMQTYLAEHARIVRTSPNSPTLALRHENHCAALSGGKCGCDAAWMLRPVKGGAR
jgi:hypothetical protein